MLLAQGTAGAVYTAAVNPYVQFGVDATTSLPTIRTFVGGVNGNAIVGPQATTSNFGFTKLSDATNSQDSTIAASSKAVADKVKRLYIFEQYDETTGNNNYYVSASPIDYNSETPPVGLTQTEINNFLINARLNNELVLLQDISALDWIYIGPYVYNSTIHYFIGSNGSTAKIIVQEGYENTLAELRKESIYVQIEDIHGTLPVSKGGTGRSSVNSRGVLYGSLDGSTIQSTQAGTLGQVLVNDGASNSDAVPT